jgi:hypothetical protein
MAIAAFTFLYRLLTLRDFTNDHFMQLAWAQQLLFGELPGRDFLDPGQPLATAISALGQWVAPGPFSEAVICAAMLGVTAALLHVVVTRMTGSALVGLAAAAASVALAPRFYNYPKLLVPAVALWLLQRYGTRRDRRTLVLTGGWIAAATLLRHDLGIYAALAVATGLVVVEWPRAGAAARALVTTAVATLVIALPYVVFVSWSEGIAEHVRVGLEFTGNEAHQLRYAWPAFPALAAGNPLAWDHADSTAALYYLSGLLPPLGALLLALRGRTLREPAVAAAALVFLACYVPVILRDPLDQRLPDLAAPLTVSAAAALVIAWRAAWALRAVVAALLVVMTVSVWQLGRVPEGFRQSGLASPLRIPAKLSGLARAGLVWPWTPFWPNSGGLPDTVRYLATCTGEDDAIMLSASSPEYYFFARRRFAGGLALFSSPEAFASTRDDELMTARLEQERPVLVIINEAERRDFKRGLPGVHQYIDEHYVPVASFQHYDEAEMTIAARRDLRPVTTWGDGAWPCYRDS